MTTYPANIDTIVSLPSAVDNVTPIRAVSVNILRDAILAIENTLGPGPASVYGTVGNRLTVLENAINSGGGGGSFVAGWTPSGISNFIVSETPYSVQTTNATATTIATIATTSGYAYRVDVVIMTLEATDGYSDVLSNTHAGLFSNISGTLTQLGATLNGVALGTTGGLTWTGLTMAVSSTNILVKVTGAASTTINWRAQIRLTVTT